MDRLGRFFKGGALTKGTRDGLGGGRGVDRVLTEEGTETGGRETEGEGGARRTVIEEVSVGTEGGGGEGEGRGADRFLERREILAELSPGFDLLWMPGTVPYTHF